MTFEPRSEPGSGHHPVSEHPEFRRYRRVGLIITLLILLILGLSIYWGWRGLLPTWGDEAFTVRITHGSWSDFYREIHNDVHPPLYFALSKLAVDISPEDSSAPYAVSPAVRTLAYIIFLGLIWFTIRLTARRMMSPREVILAVLLIFSSAHLALFGPMLRYYSLAALGATCSTLLLLPPIRIPRNWPKKTILHRSVWYGIALWIALASSYITAIIIPAHIIWLLTHRSRESRLYWIALGIVFLACIPFMWLLPQQIQNTIGASGPGFGGLLIGAAARFAFTIYSFLLGEFLPPWEPVPVALGAAAFVVLLMLTWRSRSTSLGNLIWLTLGISIPLGALILSRIGIGLEFSASRLFFLAPMFLILLALGPNVPGTSKLMQQVGMYAVLALVVVNLLSTYHFYKKTDFIQSTYIIPWAKIASDLEEQSWDYIWFLYDDETLLYWLPNYDPEASAYNLHDVLNGSIGSDERAIIEEKPGASVLTVYAPSLFPASDLSSENQMRELVNEIFNDEYQVIFSADYVVEDETSMAWKSILLGRPVNEVKKKLIVYNAAG